MTLDLRQLRFAVTAADTSSFLRASKQLNVKQSTLSKKVAALEHRLGITLFERSTRGVAPTDAATLGAQTKDTGSGQFVYENGTILGRRVIESTHATAGTVYVGIWQECLIDMWGGLDLIIDPYSAWASGIVNIYASQLADVAVRHLGAFSAITLTP